MQPDYTDVTVVLDRSGSMSSIRDDMEGGFSAFVARQQALPGRCLVTMVQFDSRETEVRYAARPIGEVGPLGLEPRGGTPLLDATAFAIRTTGERLAAMPEAERPGQVLVLIITDGQENASRETTAKALRQMIEHQQRCYQWEFIYLGANVDAFAEGGKMGIPAGRNVNFDADVEGVQASWSVVDQKLAHLRRGDRHHLDFSPAERKRMKKEKPGGKEPA